MTVESTVDSVMATRGGRVEDTANSKAYLQGEAQKVEELGGRRGKHSMRQGDVLCELGW